MKTRRRLALLLAGDLRKCAQLVDSALAELALVPQTVAVQNATEKLAAAHEILRGER
ncbi:MAG TPA: hypothetical protein VH395_08925 [Jatrophihabitantaceae bacterium]